MLGDHGEKLFRPVGFMGINMQIPFMHCSTLVRRELFEEIGTFNTRFDIAADCDFFLRVHSLFTRSTFTPSIITVMREAGISDILYHRGRRQYLQSYLSNHGRPFRAAAGYFVSLAIGILGKIKNPQ